MSYVLDDDVAAKLAKPLPIDKGVARVDVSIAPDHNGEDAVFFRVVLKDDLSNTKPSAEFGSRLQRIASALRDRVALARLPMFGHVQWVLESDLPSPRKHKST